MNLFTWVITVLIAYVPHVSVYFLKRYWLGRDAKLSKIPSWELIFAAVLYPIARFLPEPSITDESVTILQHFVGGGFVSALHFIYIRKAFMLKMPWYMNLVSLYAMVSTLGATNEILEFTATKLGIYQLHGGDAWWDLVVNTTGAFAFYTAYSLIRVVSKPKN
jgi:hypothetical protein